jgi:hypothetical protein
VTACTNVSISSSCKQHDTSRLATLTYSLLNQSYPLLFLQPLTTLLLCAQTF